MSLASLVSSLSDTLVLFLYNSLVAYSDPRSDILKDNVLRSSPAAVSPLGTTTSLRNGGRRAEFSAAQLWRLFDLDISPTAAQRRDFVVGRRILFPATEKARSELIVTMVRDSSNSTKAKAATV